jgi:hypothetical protein
MRRGAGTPACTEGVDEIVDGGVETTLCGTEATGEEAGGGAATTTAGREGGAALTAASACLRSRIALTASPGFETLERSNFGLFSTAGLFGLVARPPDLK